MALQDKIRRIDELAAALKALQPMSPEQQHKLDEKLRLEFHYNTNHIEGNTLTYGETKLAILFDQVSEGHSLREFEEMKASDVAYKYVQGLAKETERPLTETFIKDLNKILLVREYYKEAITPDGQETRRLISLGDYKQHPNSVRLENGEMFHYASPTETPAMMTEMVNWYRGEEAENAHHAVVVAAMLHYRFVRIHPFDDGNGRVSRLLMNYVLFKNGYPPVVIKSDDKPNYLRALNKADAGDEAAFFEYIAEQLIWSLELSIKAAKGEDIEEQQDWKKKLALLDRELSGKERVQIVKSKETINKIIIDLFSVVDRIWQDLDSSFRDYFAAITIRYDSTPNESYYNYIDLVKSDVLTNVDLFNPYKSDFEDTIPFIIQFNSFKKNGFDSFDIQIKLIVNFERVGYRFSNGSKVFASLLYVEDMSNINLTKIVDFIAKDIVEKIEQEVAKTKSE